MSPAEKIAPELLKEAELQEFARLFAKYYDSDWPRIQAAWDHARILSFQKRGVKTDGR